MLQKICQICKKPFDKKMTGCIKISVKQKKGEKVAWLCPDDAPRLSVK